MTGKTYDDERRRHDAIGVHGVKFVRLVKKDIAAIQSEMAPPGCYIDSSAVDIYKFPEIVTLTGKREVTHILKIVYRI
jgi:hypothetical protein